MDNVIDMAAARQKKAEQDHGERQIVDEQLVKRVLFAGQYYLSCKDDGVQIEAKCGSKPGEYVVVALVTTANAYVEFFEAEMKRFGLEEDDIFIMCSSSMDHPDEYTDRQDIIALCDAIRAS
jgi:hypothetical protein